ncbi:MAG: hypothetical protein ACTSPD_09960 [Promethearchaeota archaeon]
MRIFTLLLRGFDFAIIVFCIWFIGGLIHLTYHYFLEWMAVKILKFIGKNQTKKGDDNE